MLKLKGVVPALTTPFKKDLSLDIDSFRRLVDILIEEGVHGLVATGCTGESWAIEPEEFQELFTAAVEQARGRVPIVGGCSGITPRQVIKKATMAKTAGCDAVMIQPPYYALPGEDEVFDFYKEITSAVDIPVMVYNIPRRNGINMSVKLVDRLADLPGVFSIKESSKDFLHLSAIIRQVSDRIDVFAGYAAVLGIGAITAGAVGFVDSTAVLYGRGAVDFYDAIIAGDFEKARHLQAEMASLQDGMFGIGTFPSALKAACEFVGRPGGWTRPPIKPLDAEKRAKVHAVLTKAGLIPSDARRAVG
ncbi:MAG: dihydrodipicolinate synthase family protein [Rhodospirillales bacterium]|nr:dihydrodipicolinate synthase family protein [Rhodospirillales bacterium]